MNLNFIGGAHRLNLLDEIFNCKFGLVRSRLEIESDYSCSSVIVPFLISLVVASFIIAVTGRRCKLVVLFVVLGCESEMLTI